MAFALLTLYDASLVLPAAIESTASPTSPM
jgi:hypothetical protein